MISGVCSICGKVGFTHTCPLCGKQVCGAHFNHERGACITCLRGKF